MKEVWDLFFVWYILYAVWIATGKKPVMPTLWYYLAKDWQRAARMFGELGIGAEALYGDAMRKRSLA